VALKTRLQDLFRNRLAAGAVAAHKEQLRGARSRGQQRRQHRQLLGAPLIQVRYDGLRTGAEKKISEKVDASDKFEEDASGWQRATLRGKMPSFATTAIKSLFCARKPLLRIHVKLLGASPIASARLAPQ